MKDSEAKAIIFYDDDGLHEIRLIMPIIPAAEKQGKRQDTFIVVATAWDFAEQETTMRLQSEARFLSDNYEVTDAMVQGKEPWPEELHP